MEAHAGPVPPGEKTGKMPATQGRQAKRCYHILYHPTCPAPHRELLKGQDFYH